MDALERYTKRVTLNGDNPRDRFKNDTKAFVLANFEDSPSFKHITVYREYKLLGTYGVRINSIERMGNIRDIVLKPDVDLDVGNTAIFEDRTWLLYDKFGHEDDHVRITAIRTNQNLKWIDADGILHAERCFASASDMGSKSKQNRADVEYNKYDIKLPYGQLYVFIEKNINTDKIGIDHRFIINNVVFEVVGMDNASYVEDNYGIIQFTVKRTQKMPQDDFELGIANNVNIYDTSDQSEEIRDETEEKIEENKHKVDRKGGRIF